MATQKSPHVPKFGNFDEENVPYTAYFDSARKDKGGSVRMNPNDPEENPNAFKMYGSFDNGSGKSPKSPAPLHNRKRSDKSNASDDYSYNRGSTSVPKFGDWNERDPSMSAGYTVIFNNIKEEKKVAATIPDVQTPPAFVNEPRPNYRNRRNRSSSKMGCCFF